MSGRIVEGLWDCPYCNSKRIGGLTKHCPTCGHPQDENTHFYMGEKKNYLEDTATQTYGKGADWVCEYCGSLNRVNYKYCSNCSAPKDESTKDYFSNKGEKKTATASQSGALKAVYGKNNNKKFKHFWEVEEEDSFATLLRACILNPLTIGIVAIIALIIFLARPVTDTVKVEDKNWSRSIEVEDWRTVQESDWEVPESGRVYDKQREIHHYTQVLDHYETESRLVSEQVYDGEDVSYYYVDNGDGTFTEETQSTPRYRTETHTENVSVPVYRDEPVYETKYYYEIEKWIVIRTETSEGGQDEPYWPEINLSGMEREGTHSETYCISCRDADKNKSYNFELPQRIWETIINGSEIEITHRGDNVEKINGQEIESY